MRREQRKYIQALRGQLGSAMRAADDVVAPLKAQLEAGYRWEPVEMVTAKVALEDLVAVARAVAPKLRGLITQYRASLKASARERLEGARKGIEKGATVLESIDPQQIFRRQKKWLAGGLPWRGEEGEVMDISEGHEAYFLSRYNLGMKLLRAAWNKLFFVTQEASPRRIKLTEREVRAFRDPMSDVHEAVKKQAIRMARDSGRVVEILDAQGELIDQVTPDSKFVEGQSQALIERGRKAKRGDWAYKGRRESGQVLRLADASPEEALAVQAIIAKRPGISIREAAAEVGVEVIPYPTQPMSPNASGDKLHRADIEIHDALWSLELDDY